MRDENGSGDQLAPTGFDSWRAYWAAQGMPWRIEPKIDGERQAYLAGRCKVRPEIEQGIYPFAGIKLTRADVEWLLSNHESHENHRGPIDWENPQRRGYTGLDLRAADLMGENLSRLPLSRMRGGLTQTEVSRIPAAQQTLARERAAVHLEATNLTEALLQGAYLRGAHLESAYMRRAHLEAANLQYAHLNGSDLRQAHLEGTHLLQAHFEGAEWTVGSKAQVTQAVQGKWWGTDLPDILPPANLQSAFVDSATGLQGVIFGNARLGCVSLADVRWDNANLALIEWDRVNMLGDERVAQQRELPKGGKKVRPQRLSEYQIAVRANRQLSTALRDQGLNDDANKFAYRAQVLQRTVLRLQHKRLAFAGSWLLDFISGYGYEPIRSLATYVIVILGFAVAYRLFGNQVHPPLGSLDAVVFSITSFHGRGFSPGEVVTLHNPLTVLAAIEAIIGLLIEITFIATFTQRFFAR